MESNVLLERARQAIAQGHGRAAADLLRMLETQQPHDPHVQELLAIHRLKAGDAAGSLNHLQLAVEFAHPDPAFLCGLARLAHALGNLELAQELFQRAVNIDDTHVDGWWLCAHVQAARGLWLQALASLRRAYELCRGDRKILEKLVDLELDHGLPDDGVQVVQQWAQLNPFQVDAQLKLGVVLGRLFRHDDAVVHYRQALKKLPDAPDLWMALGQSLEYVGDAQACVEAYRRALELRPGWALPIAGLLDLTRKVSSEGILAKAYEALADQGLSNADRAVLGYAVGKHEDALGHPAAAMSAWKMANAARQRQIGAFDTERLLGLLERTEAAFPDHAGTMNEEGCPPSGMVLIVGMPRSGTTLVEQIIHSHTQAHGAGELLDLTLLANRLDAGGKEWPEAIHDLSVTQCALMAREYLRSARARADPEAIRIVDKAPLNFFFLGLAAKLFPDLRVIWCRRDPRDVALSIYAENFSLDAPFSTCWDGIAHYQSAESRLMALWKKVLRVPMLELSYEEMVTKPEEQARRLIDFIDLEWQEGCLRFHAGQSVVQTPSRWQVREAVHTRSVARWRSYQEDMEPFMSHARALGIL